MILISELIEKLANLGIKVYIGESGEARLQVPNPVPPGARPLLAELKQRKGEVMEYLTWDEPCALAILQEALGRIKLQYPAGAIPWAVEYGAECYQALKQAEARFNQAYQGQDMPDCRIAIVEYERVFGELINTYLKEGSN